MYFVLYKTEFTENGNKKEHPLFGVLLLLPSYDSDFSLGKIKLFE